MSELLQALFEQLLSVVLFAPLGFLYLKVRYRHHTLIQQVLAKEYEYSYTNAGITFSLQVLAVFGILLVLSLMAVLMLHALRF